MSYTNLTIEQRNVVEALCKKSYSTRAIAKIVEVHHSTIARELKRCPEGKYSAEQAQTHADTSKSKRGRKSILNDEIANLIEDKLNMTWSPEQIVGRNICIVKSFKTIYNWLHAKSLRVSTEVLRRKGKAPKSAETRGKFTVGPTIHDRSEKANSRQEFGHWELDSVVSSRGESTSCLATFTERKTRFNIAVRMPNRKKETMLTAIQNTIATYGIHAFKSFTADRGKEFAEYKIIIENGIEFYFADAYSAWQRGTNENANGLIREFFPKKTNFENVSDYEVAKSVHLINNRPRKVLGYKTATEAFIEEIQKLNLVSH